MPVLMVLQNLCQTRMNSIFTKISGGYNMITGEGMLLDVRG
jgi:hypothetical protein